MSETEQDTANAVNPDVNYDAAEDWIFARRILGAVRMYKGENSAYKFQIEDRLDEDIEASFLVQLCTDGYLEFKDGKYSVTEKGKEFI